MPRKSKIIRDVPITGEALVMQEAIKNGFNNRRTQWCNFSQGQPEVSQFQNAPTRLSWITLETHDHESSPVAGSDELRDSIAEYYNRMYREDLDSRYKRENVSVAPGSRVALSRVLNALGDGKIGYRNPDCPLYQILLNSQEHRLKPVGLDARPDDNFCVEVGQLDNHVAKKKLNAFLLSNPCNPTGQAYSGVELKKLVTTSRKNRCVMIMDEVYSHYVFGMEGEGKARPLSVVPFVGNVDRDPILIVDGLGKGWRYPGWRLSWIVGPVKLIEAVNKVARYLDGGTSVPAQRLAVKALEESRTEQERSKGLEVFTEKRAILTEKFETFGMKFVEEPCGTFYVWADIRGLPKGLNNADKFFRRGLEEKLISIPGRYFNIKPGNKTAAAKQLKNWVRFSFAPSMTSLSMGVETLGAMIEDS
ncbi:uncharacterized protein METZ01_LOCUS118152 [marine metagenome]|uniref:Aminotransferase class I/classII large domain-containing protein n=1 Tax=marine metagenome TaxID=408172 RepID=A0A381XKN9_9ZZZZ